ncbi:ScyD/ScyE family protein [Nocardioides sp. LHG3406-4]|uniref:ScyD/ScyE family protein n=1 Tax=Nocardioides sp. LHG3406-4 TaxID=2804575 RepID=UPI003CF14904
MSLPTRLLPTPRRRAAVVLATALTVVSTLLLAPAPAIAGGSHGHGSHGPDGPPWTVVASGLDNPRQISIDESYSQHYGRRHGGDHGRGHGYGHKPVLYVAEAGRGGDGACVEGPEGPACFGLSGAVTRVRHGHQARVVSGLPSLAAADGSQAIGPADVAVHGSWYAVTVGLGNDPAVRLDIPGGERLGTLLAGRFGGGQIEVADLAQSEADEDPDGAGPDSNPTGLLTTHRGFVVTDSGANALQAVSWHGDVSTLATFPERLVPPPPFLPPGDIPMQSVPTSVVRGPDGAWYVSELTGFPFPADGARIYRVVPGQAPTVYATGLTNVTDLAWHGRKLYAVQIAGDAGLLAAEGLPMGSLVRVDRDGSHKTVAEDLPAPYGVAIDDGNAYVTTCSVCAGEGGVVRIPLW